VTGSLNLQGHVLGCAYFGLSVLNEFMNQEFRLNWVDAWVQETFVNYDWRTSSELYDYVVMLFKGFSVLTNLGYEITVPELLDEMAMSIFAQNVKVIIDAYILGTLFHNLVKKDPEAARELMSGLHAYCKQRQLPAELVSKMEAYIHFQQKHSSAVANSIRYVRPRHACHDACVLHESPEIQTSMNVQNVMLRRLLSCCAEATALLAKPYRTGGVQSYHTTQYALVCKLQRAVSKPLHDDSGGGVRDARRTNIAAGRHGT
jgi:hypothetical protein